MGSVGPGARQSAFLEGGVEFASPGLPWFLQVTICERLVLGFSHLNLRQTGLTGSPGRAAGAGA